MTNKKNEDTEKKTEENNEIQKLKNELEECKEEKNKYLNGWKRAKADFQNYKKKEDERLQSFKKRNEAKILQDLITILDSFELSILSSEGEKVEKKGVELIKGQLESILKNYGLKNIETSIGDEFNPEIHEAVERVESDKPEGEVVEVIKTGYKASEKVIRPSQVKVSQGN